LTFIAMAFNCTNGFTAHDVDADESLRRDPSAFGDAYSVRTRSTHSASRRSISGDHDRDRDHSLSGNGGGIGIMNRHISAYDNDEPEVDYDNGATDLYRYIENKDWDAALSRLESYPIEAKTWVLRNEPNSRKVRWRLLPLHAVCIFRAPLALIEALIEVYPDGPKMKDDQGM
jgi:hypothetical protein